jgi:hypothetical protein
MGDDHRATARHKVLQGLLAGIAVLAVEDVVFAGNRQRL